MLKKKISRGKTERSLLSGEQNVSGIQFFSSALVSFLFAEQLTGFQTALPVLLIFCSYLHPFPAVIPFPFHSYGQRTML